MKIVFYARKNVLRVEFTRFGHVFSQKCQFFPNFVDPRAFRPNGSKNSKIDARRQIFLFLVFLDIINGFYVRENLVRVTFGMFRDVFRKKSWFSLNSYTFWSKIDFFHQKIHGFDLSELNFWPIFIKFSGNISLMF